MIAYRITRDRFADLSGEGGLNLESRCNVRGTRVIYAAHHASLSLLEVLVHLPKRVPKDYVLLTIEIPEYISAWRKPASWIKEESKQPKHSLYLVPSVIVPQEMNVVMFPEAPNFDAAILNKEPFPIDERLLTLLRRYQVHS